MSYQLHLFAFALLLGLNWSVPSAFAGEPDCAVRLRTEGVQVEVLELRGTCPNGYVEGWARVRYTLEDGNRDGYEGEHHDGWREGEGTYFHHDGSVYEGSWRRSQAHGQGRYEWSNGWRYEGDYQDGKYHGDGQLSHEDGRRWVGEFRDGLLNGEAVFTGSDGTRYEGHFVDGKTDGEGTMRYADGRVYVGDWKEGRRHGRGVGTAPDGRRWEGEYKDDAANGQIIFTMPDGTRYEGEFLDGNMHGQGTYTWPDGDRYVGSFKDGKKDGWGRYAWVEGQVYEGEYKDDQRHGTGTQWTADGRVEFRGDWVRGATRPDGGYRTTRWGMSPEEAIAALSDENIIPMEPVPSPRFRKQHDLPRGAKQELFCGSKEYADEREFYFYKDTIAGHPATVFLCFNPDDWKLPGLFQVRINFSRPTLHAAAEIAQALETKYGGAAHTSKFIEADELTPSSQTEKWTWPTAGIWMKYHRFMSTYLWLQYDPPTGRSPQSTEGL